MSLEGAKPRTLVFGTIEQEGLTFTSAALSICLLCVSLIAYSAQKGEARSVKWVSYERGKTKRRKESQRRKLLEPKTRYGKSDHVAEG